MNFNETVAMQKSEEDIDYTQPEYSRPKAIFGAFYALILLVGVTAGGTVLWMLIIDCIAKLFTK